MENENKQVKERFFKDLETGKKFMEPIHQLMDKNYNMYRNRWEDSEGKIKVSDLYSYVETVVPILTNNRTRGNVKAEYPDYVKHAEGMGYILDHVFDTNNWDYKAQRVARMAEIYRSALVYTGYDETANNKTGKLCITEINPRWCYIDPAVTELEDSSFFIYVEPMRISKVVKMYPKKAKEIKERKENGSYNTEGKGNWFKNLFQSVANSLATFSGNQMARLGETTLPEMDEAEKRKNAIAFVHYWYRDDDDEWRVAYFADDIFLEDAENPFHHGRLPYDIYNPTEDILSSLGVPMSEHIENLNEEKNLLLSTIVKHGKKSVDPPMMVNTTAGIKDTRALKDGGDNGIIPIANPDYIPLNAIAQYMLPSQLPGFFDAMPDRFDAIIDKLTGVNDSFRGMSEATSGKEVQLKQEAAYTRIKTKVDNFEKFVKNMSEKIVVNAMQFLNTQSAFRVKGDYRQFENMNEDETPFMVEPIQSGITPDGQPEFNKQEFFLYANPNEWTQIEGEQSQEGEEGTKEAFRILQMTVEIEAGSSLPTSRMARREEALELFGAGVIDQQALLEAYDYPQREEIMKRMQEVQQAQQEAQMMAEQEKMAQQQAQSQAQMEQQLMMKQMEQEAKVAQSQAKQEQPQQAPDLASQIDQLKQIVPELQNMSDEQIMQVIASMTQG
jgi:hypothetical protein